MAINRYSQYVGNNCSDPETIAIILFIADIQNCFHNSYILLYADDVKIYKVINSESDAERL